MKTNAIGSEREAIKMKRPKVVSPQEWEAVRQQLLVK